MFVRAPISTAIAVGVGLIVLAALSIPGMNEIGGRILDWAVLLAGLALVLGLVNLLRVHLRRVRERKQPLYSLVLLISMLGTFGITLWQGSRAPIPNWIFLNLQVPIESSLMALLTVSLTLAAARLMQNRLDLMSMVFLVTLFVLLLGAAPLFGVELPLFTRVISPYVSNFLSVASTRGLLIGVGLGTLATGARILIGADRPYDG
jgi:hypothetical protein